MSRGHTLVGMLWMRGASADLLRRETRRAEFEAERAQLDVLREHASAILLVSAALGRVDVRATTCAWDEVPGSAAR